MAAEVPMQMQERAYTSPWYTPPEVGGPRTGRVNVRLGSKVDLRADERECLLCA
jgi:hypothetical protein